MASKKNPRATSYLQAAKRAAERGDYGRTTRALSKYQKKKLRETAEETRSKRARAGNRSRRNPNGKGAAQAYKDFHGRSASEVLELNEALLQSGDYTALGDNPEIWLRPLKGEPETWGEAEISFEPSDQVKLATGPMNGAKSEQLYLVGKNQALPLAALQRAGVDTSKRFISLGEAHAISYTTEKVFDGYKSIPYAHRFGEETGERPTLIYDKQTKRLLLVGGAYSIAPVDGDLGASPGIVN